MNAFVENCITNFRIVRSWTWALSKIPKIEKEQENHLKKKCYTYEPLQTQNNLEEETSSHLFTGNCQTQIRIPLERPRKPQKCSNWLQRPSYAKSPMRFS